MKESASQISYPSKWRFLYRAAIFETNNFKRVKKLSDAEKAIIERIHELLCETGDDVAEETEAVDDAMYALRAWKGAIENRTNAA